MSAISDDTEGFATPGESSGTDTTESEQTLTEESQHEHKSKLNVSSDGNKRLSGERNRPAVDPKRLSAKSNVDYKDIPIRSPRKKRRHETIENLTLKTVQEEVDKRRSGFAELLELFGIVDRGEKLEMEDVRRKIEPIIIANKQRKKSLQEAEEKINRMTTLQVNIQKENSDLRVQLAETIERMGQLTRKSEESTKVIKTVHEKLTLLVAELDNKDAELKVLTERKNQLEGQQSDSEELTITKNQLFLILSEKNDISDKIIRENFDYLQNNMDNNEQSKTVRHTRKLPIPPPPPMSDGASLGGIGHYINLRGQLHSSIAKEAFKNSIDKAIKGVKLSTLRSIDISDTVLDKTQLVALSEALPASKTVNSLNFQRVKLGSLVTTLCEGLAANESVTAINLSNTAITAEGFKGIALALRQNAALQTLDISHNVISDHSAEHLANSLKVNVRLSSLNCFGTNMSSEAATFLIDAIKENDRFYTLNLGNNRIGDASLVHVAAWLEKSSFLNSLNLSQNQITAEGIKYLMEGLSKAQSIASLNLRGNKLGKEGSKYIAQFVQVNTSLVILDISSNRLSPEGIKEIVGALQKNKHSQLENISIWGSQLTRSVAAAFANMLKTNTTLSTVNIRATCLESDGAIDFANAIRKNSTLASINMTGNSIGGSGASEIAQAISTNNSIYELVLSGNLISDFGAKALGAALEQNTTLSTLQLDLNSIGDSGCMELSKALKSNSTIIELDLSFNHIGIAGFQELGAALKVNTSIATLRLEGNSAGDEAIVAFVENAIENEVITNLDLSSNRIRYDGMVAIARLISHELSHIQSLYLRRNGLKDDDLIMLCSNLKNNSCLRKLDLEGNFIQYAGVKAIAEVILLSNVLNHISLLQNPLDLAAIQVIEEACSRNTRVICLTDSLKL